MNDIIKLLNLEDPDVIISSVNLRDDFAFIAPGHRSTNLTDILILENFKVLNLSAASIARKFHASPKASQCDYPVFFYRRYKGRKSQAFQRSDRITESQTEGYETKCPRLQ